MLDIDLYHPHRLSEGIVKHHAHLSSCVAEILTTCTSLPTHNNPGQHPCASPLGWCQPPAAPVAAGTSGSFINLAMPLSTGPVTVILATSSLRAGANHGGNHFLHYEPDVSGHMGKQGRWIEGENEQARETETMLSLPFLYLFMVFLAHGALKALWEWSTLPLPLRHNQLLLNWIVS